MSVEQTRILSDHYFAPVTDFLSSKGRWTNTEITFSIHGESMAMHQGESRTYRNYKISLPTAFRITGYSSAYGAPPNLSYTISRLSESMPRVTRLPTEDSVDFPDTALSKAIAAATRRETGSMTKLDLVGLVALQAAGAGIASLAGLGDCVGLRSIDLRDNLIENVTPLSRLTGLRDLDLKGNRISDPSPLFGLRRVQKLNVAGNPFPPSAIDPLVNWERQLNLQFNLRVDVSPADGSVNVLGSQHSPGSSVTLTAKPIEWNTRFDRWSGDASGTDPTITVTMISDMVVKPNFVRLVHLMTRVDPVDGGAISPGGGTYDMGTVLELVAIPGPGYTFDRWAGDARGMGSSPSITITMNRSWNVMAVFR